jgi:lipoyl(octanoyl) transferase
LTLTSSPSFPKASSARLRAVLVHTTGAMEVGTGCGRQQPVSGSTAADPNGPAPRKIRWAWLGRAPYAEVLALQERIREGVIQGTECETLLLVEHPPVITLGRNANAANVLASPQALAEVGVSVARVSRGGDVTFHGPGQLVGYPVFRLHDGVRAHVMTMGRAIVAVLAELGIAASWRDSQPGVWLGSEKICAVGVHVRRRVAIHGFALNVSVDLGSFAAIVPCGLRAFGVTSIAKALGRAPAMDEMADRTARSFERCFGIHLFAQSRLQIAKGNL